jgi:hypothetical protein
MVLGISYHEYKLKYFKVFTFWGIISKIVFMLLTASVVSSEFLTTDPEVRVRFPALPDFRVPRGQRDGSLWPYSRISRPEPLLFHPTSSSVVLTRTGSNIFRIPYFEPD